MMIIESLQTKIKWWLKYYAFPFKNLRRATENYSIEKKYS